MENFLNIDSSLLYFVEIPVLTQDINAVYYTTGIFSEDVIFKIKYDLEKQNFPTDIKYETPRKFSRYASKTNGFQGTCFYFRTQKDYEDFLRCIRK